ncbi:hypothetical protein HY967_04465 [Candidatus Jorgensenbacteria bacterium]|nr:hypothetical protein [Candidatus Jorgensenbacteria bacterium]
MTIYSIGSTLGLVGFLYIINGAAVIIAKRTIQRMSDKRKEEFLKKLKRQRLAKTNQQKIVRAIMLFLLKEYMGGSRPKIILPELPNKEESRAIVEQCRKKGWKIKFHYDYTDGYWAEIW